VRIYDLRSTFISNALASGLTIFDAARIAGDCDGGESLWSAARFGA